MKHRTEGHTETTISGDTRADWSEGFELVLSLEVAYVWHASVYTREVLNGLERIGFLYPEQIIWNKSRIVLTRTHYWYQHEPCWYVRTKNAPLYGKAGQNAIIRDSPSPKFIMGGSDEDKFDHPTQKPMDVMRPPILNRTLPGEAVYDCFLGSGTTLMAAEQNGRVCYGSELDPKYVDVIVRRWQGYTGKQAVLEGFSLTMTSPCFFVRLPPALSIALVVCLSQPMAVIISSRVVPPSHFSMAITWLVLLPSCGVPGSVAVLGAFSAHGRAAM